ncbi:MAG: DUF2612 domain-containing protein [Clostridia bacterium]|nr:DUF2612 domain-containing protein [Clostridia bacterium]
MYTLESYLSLFPPSSRQKPRFLALASAVLGQATDLLRLVQVDFPAAWNLETSSGAALDALGALLNVPRPASDTSDEDYRLLLRARVFAHHWDGTNGSLPALLAAALPGQNIQLLDNQDGTVTAVAPTDLPFPLRDLIPLPAGVRLIETPSA